MIGLEVEHAVHGVGGLAVVHVHAPYAAGHFAADAHQAVALDDLAVAHDHVLGGRGEPPGVLVAAGLDHHRVVTLVEDAVFHDGVLRHLEVDAVVVVPVGVHLQAVHPGVLAEVEMDGPEGAVLDAEPAELHVLAAVELDQVRAHVGLALLHPAVLHRDAGRAHRVELARGLDVRLGAVEPGAPEVHFRMDEPRAAYAYVLTFVGIDQRGVVHAFRPLPGGVYGRQIELRVVLEHQFGPFGEPELAVAFEVDGAGQPDARRHDHASAAGLPAGRHRLGESLRGGRDVAGLGAVLRDGKVLRRENEHLQRGEFERRLRGGDDGLRAGAKAARGQQGEGKEETGGRFHGMYYFSNAWAPSMAAGSRASSSFSLVIRPSSRTMS